MKKILLLSDTHSHLEDRILHYASKADEIWHAGDIGTIAVTDELKKIKPLIAVYGNIDGAEVRKEFPKDQIFNCEGIKVFMTHIGGYPPKYTPPLKNRLQNIQPDIFICGHSHILKVMYDKDLNILHLNPGACGKYGQHTVKTMVQFKINKGNIKDLEVIELKQ